MTMTASSPKSKELTTQDRVQNVVNGIRCFSYTTPDEVSNQLKKIIKNEELALLKKGIVARAAAQNKTLDRNEIVLRLAIVEDATDWTTVGFTQRYADLERIFLANYRRQSPLWQIIPTLIEREWSLKRVT
jgi:hypothetical protein